MTLRNTVAEFIGAEIQSRHLSQRALALGAGISESVVRNLLKHGLDPKAKDPDPRTLRAVADYLSIDPLVLFRLAGYLPPERNAHTVRAEFIAQAFDQLQVDKQDAVLGVIEALTTDLSDRIRLQDIRADPENVFSGFDTYWEDTLILVANRLILEAHAEYAFDLDRPSAISDHLRLYPIGPSWSEMTEEVRHRILGLAKAKLNLKYDPTMVDVQWRKSHR